MISPSFERNSAHSVFGFAFILLVIVVDSNVRYANVRDFRPMLATGKIIHWGARPNHEIKLFVFYTEIISQNCKKHLYHSLISVRKYKTAFRALAPIQGCVQNRPHCFHIDFI